MIIAPVATPEFLQAREEWEAHELAMVGGHHAPERADWTEKHEEQDDTSYEYLTSDTEHCVRAGISPLPSIQPEQGTRTVAIE
eukprot:5610372-Pyramimonas_sp.AAC.1